MTTTPNTPTSWRPRFSVRTLVVIVTLVCAYAACWGPTKRACEAEFLVWHKGHGEIVVLAYPKPVLPLIVSVNRPSLQRHYYFWFFGFTAKLPYETERVFTPHRE